MLHKGHLQTFNHFSIVALDAGLFRRSWETAFDFKIPEIVEQSDSAQEVDLSHFFTHAPSYRGGAWPAPTSFGVEQVGVPPIYQPDERMIEVKAAGTMQSGTDFYRRYGNGIQYLGIVEGDNRDPFLDELSEKYGCEKLEEMFYDPLPGDFCIVETEPQLGFNLCVKQDGALNGRVEVILPPTAEAAVVTEDLDASVKLWSDIFDIQAPKIETVKETCTLRGQKTQAQFRFARIDETPFPLYLVESGSTGPFAEFAGKAGHGIHHIAFDLGDQRGAFMARMKELLGIEILAEYDLDGAHYTLYDSVEKMGAIMGTRSR